MQNADLCKLIYEDDKGGTHEKSTPITSLKTDAFGLTFYDTDISMLTTLTWDRLANFKIEGSPSKEMVDKSKTNQAYYSDVKAKNSFNRTV